MATDSEPRRASTGGNHAAVADVSSEQWPAKRPIFGVDVSVTNYDELAGAVIRSASERRPACITALAVHGLMTATKHPEFHAILRAFDAVAPDGQPLRFALNLLHRAGLKDRVRAVELALEVSRRAEREHVKLFLFGSLPHVVEALRAELLRRFPQLEVVGCEPGIYRSMTAAEDDALVDRFNRSNADLLLIGLGCPHQEIFAFEHRTRVKPVQMCIGAAFDFISRNKASAPEWMQRVGLEWLFRLGQEPGRLWKRYLDTNLRFIGRLLATLVGFAEAGGTQRRQRGRNS